IRDITEITEAKNQVDIAKTKVENARGSKARFLSSMSHELRTPLNGIIGTSSLILSEPNLKEDFKKHINVIRYSSEHMLNIINDILDFSKIDARKMEVKEATFNLADCLNNVTSSFSLQFKSHNIELTTQFPTDELQNMYVLSDQMKLSQILKNLLSNSLKFTVNGNVKLNVQIKESSDKYITLYFEVKDTGIGIAKEKQEEIFLAFSQIHSDDLKRKYEGTGLGLTISKQLVNMLGGTLEVDSELHKGSRFYFTLKFKITVPSSATYDVTTVALPIENPKINDIRGLRVLVVEDNEINANILKSFLRKWKMQIKVAITGIHALELIKYHKFDLILMDLEMPEMNGYTALKKIREKNKEIPVFAFTATLLENMDALITEAGFTDYVLKPFRPGDLKKKIETYCTRKIDYA
ncbi:MAG: response regulator, partial [Ginsengibacter sp.]